MSAVARPIEDCQHIWWLILKTDGTVNLSCESCNASDVDAFDGSPSRAIDMQIQETRIANGHHDYVGDEAWIPVDLHVTSSISYNVQARAFQRDMTATVSPRQIQMPSKTLDGELVTSTTEEIGQLEAQLGDAPASGTGWCAPSP